MPRIDWDGVSRQGRASETLESGIYRRAIFHALLRHEKSRVDRDGQVFSLVVFDLSGKGVPGNRRKEITARIREALRSIDEAGWLDEDHIGVILPGTSAMGAGHFANRVGEGLSHMRILLSNEIFSYPDQWIPTGKAFSDSRPEGSAHGGGYGRKEPDDGRGTSDGGDARKAMAKGIPAWKRIMDIVGSCAGIVLLSPLLLAVSAYIRIVSPGPVFFRQERIGYGGKPFTMTKFRTLKAGRDGEHRKERLVSMVRFDRVPGKPEDDAGQWIIPGGRFLRSSRIDELPQLFNVLQGRMSLVGPKPCHPWEAEEYRWWQARRFDILPGMTGPWQANGTERLTFLQRIRLDIAYARRVTIMGDVRILLRTLPAVAGIGGIRPAGESGKRPITATPGTKSAI